MAPGNAHIVDLRRVAQPFERRLGRRTRCRIAQFDPRTWSRIHFATIVAPGPS